ncbi:MAG: bifunctional 5,10-methylenetetrahydrofolate dehydrogenase/5,10-methenyltetrahydrofolate cyclohydrolase [Bacillota bacterium]
MEIISCKAIADRIKQDVKNEVTELKKLGIKPTLATIQIGSMKDDESYLKIVRKNCEQVGIKLIELDFSSTISEDSILEINQNIRDRCTNLIHGVLFLSNIPNSLNRDLIFNSIDPAKDTDCVTFVNIGRLYQGNPLVKPCTAEAVVEILKTVTSLKGKNVAVLGRSNIVGKPASFLLSDENATVTICHSKTENLPKKASEADILVSAVGKAKFVNRSFIKDGAVIIDCGINFDEHGTLCGDVDFNDVKDKISFITPVPSGVGVVTNAILLRNLVKLCKYQHNIV